MGAKPSFSRLSPHSPTLAASIMGGAAPRGLKFTGLARASRFSSPVTANAPTALMSLVNQPPERSAWVEKMVKMANLALPYIADPTAHSIMGKHAAHLAHWTSWQFSQQPGDSTWRDLWSAKPVS